MDANQTRFHLLLGRDDWARCREWLEESERTGAKLADCWEASPPEGHSCDLEWQSERNELTLQPEPFHFTASAGDRAPKLGEADDSATSDRRGAARDRFCNWYFISEDRREILVHSVGCKHTTSFWSCDGTQIREPALHGIFKSCPAEPPPLPPAVISGLAVTEDHYLVVGTMGPEKTRGGLLVFDLHAGGPPEHLCWPEDVPFQPFDMAPRRHGGVWILDRANRLLWALDRHMRVIAQGEMESPPGSSELDMFQPIEGAQTHSTPPQNFPRGISLEATDPVSTEALPNGTVLILDAVPDGKPSVIWHYRFSEQLGRIVLDSPLTDRLEEPDPKCYFRPAYDFAFLPQPKSATQAKPCGCRTEQPVATTQSAEPEKIGDLFIVTGQGNQTIRFELRGTGEQIQLEPSLDFYPMRLFSGMGLVAGGEQVFYDSQRRWVPLVQQERPLYAEEATLVSPEFDGREPDCVWHRLTLDGCLPSETRVRVWSRAANEQDELKLAPWQAEPTLYQRGNGSELPFVPRPISKDAGTFELLFQKARGRFVQLKLELSGNGRSTPRLRALRIYYPRFSYLRNYLPAVYREDRESASFLDRFLANVEGTNTALEDKVAAVQMLFDWCSAPNETLAWLATWFGVVLDPAWDEPRQRLFIRRAMVFFQWRGTIRGLQMALHLAFDECVHDSTFETAKLCSCRSSHTPVARKSRCRCVTDRFRVVEKFLLRRAPAVKFGEPAEDTGPQLVDKGGPWTPDKGAGELKRRFDDWRKGKGWDEFALGPGKSEEETAARVAFARGQLGFDPSDLSEDRQGWRDFLRGRYKSIDELNDAHSSKWSDFDEASIPSDQPAEGKPLDDWRDYLASDEPTPYEVKRQLWQDFLLRRYSGVNALNEKHQTNWKKFELISYPAALPTNKSLLWDWYQFESLVLPILEAAHRFTVMLPFTGHTLPEVEQRTDNLELARRLLELEKPAHTTFDVKFYWALFRVGEARLGLDTVLGLGGRDPALMPPAILGRTFLAETKLAATHPFDVTERQIVGRDWLN
jgi:phage tail-like protein